MYIEFLKHSKVLNSRIVGLAMCCTLLSSVIQPAIAQDSFKMPKVTGVSRDGEYIVEHVGLRGPQSFLVSHKDNDETDGLQGQSGMRVLKREAKGLSKNDSVVAEGVKAEIDYDAFNDMNQEVRTSAGIEIGTNQSPFSMKVFYGLSKNKLYGAGAYYQYNSRLKIGYGFQSVNFKKDSSLNNMQYSKDLNHYFIEGFYDFDYINYMIKPNIGLRLGFVQSQLKKGLEKKSFSDIDCGIGAGISFKISDSMYAKVQYSFDIMQSRSYDGKSTTSEDYQSINATVGFKF